MLPIFTKAQVKNKPVGVGGVSGSTYNPLAPTAKPNTQWPIELLDSREPTDLRELFPAVMQTREPGIPTSGGAKLFTAFAYKDAKASRPQAIPPTAHGLGSQQRAIRAPINRQPKWHSGVNMRDMTAYHASGAEADLDRRTTTSGSIGNLSVLDTYLNSTPQPRKVPAITLAAQAALLWLSGTIYQGGYGSGSNLERGNAVEF